MKQTDLKKDLIWNTAGSLLYALSSVVLSFAAMRILGSEEGGIFAFGFSTFGQQMFIIAYFGIRPFHITDVKSEYSFADYRRARVFTSGLAVLGSVLYLGILSALGRYTLMKAACILLLALYKICDGFADVYECECQRRGVLWRGGRELSIRTALSMFIFLFVLVLSRDLLISVLSSVGMQVLCIVVFAGRLSGDNLWIRTEKAGKAGLLLRSTALLFVSVFLDFFVFSSAKYAIDLKLTDADSGVFNLLFMPTNVIYLVANFIIKPFMTRMAEAYENGRETEFRKTERTITWIIAGLTVFAVLCAILLGKPVLTLFERILGDGYKGALSARVPEFSLIIFGGGLYALANLYYYILVIRRRQKRIFLVYLLASVIAALVSFPVTASWGLTGAAVSYTALMSLLVFGFGVLK